VSYVRLLNLTADCA